MKIQLRDILEESTELAYAEPVDDLNATLQSGEAGDYRLERPLDVELVFYRAEQDLFFDGRLAGAVHATCARCLEGFPIALEQRFSAVLSPEPQLSGEIELARADLSQSFYRGSEVDVTPLVYEQVMLALPTRPLCAEECRGLCARCGTNLNRAACSCRPAEGDPRLAVLRTLKVDRGR